MALTILTGSSQAAGVNYTHRTSGSADWSSVPTASYFYDIIDKLVRYRMPNGDIQSLLTFPYTGSAQITGSLGITGSLEVTAGITGSLQGTASFATIAANATGISSAITNNTNNNILTATGTGVINGESNLTFDSQTLTLTNGLLTLAGSFNSRFNQSLGGGANADYSYAQGIAASAVGAYSHAEGGHTIAYGNAAHAEGSGSVTGTARLYGAKLSTISSGVFQLAGDVTGQFTPGTRLYYNSAAYPDNTSFVVDTAVFGGVNTTITLTTNINDSNFVVGPITYYTSWTGGQTSTADGGHAEGQNTTAIANFSHAEGVSTVTFGQSSHAEGISTRAVGRYSHAEGFATQAVGIGSHAEGFNTQAVGTYSHTEGVGSNTYGGNSHAEGNRTTTMNEYDHAEGAYTIAGGIPLTFSDNAGFYFDSSSLYIVGDVATLYPNSIVAGNYIQFVAYTNILVPAPSDDNLVLVTAQILSSTYDAPNDRTTISVVIPNYPGSVDNTSAPAIAVVSNAEYDATYAVYNGFGAHAEGYLTLAAARFAHAEGFATQAVGNYSHAEGIYTIASGSYSHAEGNTSIASGYGSHAEGATTQAIGTYSHAEGQNTKTGDNNGYLATIASPGVVVLDSSYGDLTSAGLFDVGFTIGIDDSIYDNAYSFVNRTVASSSFDGTNTSLYLLDNSFSTTTAHIGSITAFASNTGDTYWGGPLAHAEGASTIAVGFGSHAEGSNTQTNGYSSHAEGGSAVTYGEYSHAEGQGIAYGSTSHAEGVGYTYGSTSHAEGSGIAGCFGYIINIAITAGVIELDPKYGDLTALFGAGGFIIIDDTQGEIVPGAVNAYLYEIASSTFNATPATEITLVDTTVNTATTKALIGIYGASNPTLADASIGNYSHAEGAETQALGTFSHAAGNSNRALGYYQSVVGQFNQPVSDVAAFIIGDGVDDSTRNNLLVAASGSVAVNGLLSVTGSLEVTGSLTLTSGSITMPNRPAFRVTGAGGGKTAVTVLSGSYLNVDYQQGSGWDNSTGTFTAPIAGLYQVNLVVRTNSNSLGTISQLIVFKNNTGGTSGTTQIMVEFGTNTSMNHVGGSTISKLAVGDTLKMVVASGQISFDFNDNFSVAYIG